MSAEHVTVLIYKFLCALNFVSSANIVHRDIKPGNVLIDSDCNVKISDFGLSRSLHKVRERIERSREATAFSLMKTRDHRKTKPRNISNHVYTRWYRPPEVILMEKSYDKSADIWAGGCVIAEIIFCQDSYLKKGSSSTYFRHLFKGNSCYPLSPLDCKDSKLENDSEYSTVVDKDD